MSIKIPNLINDQFAFIALILILIFTPFLNIFTLILFIFYICDWYKDRDVKTNLVYILSSFVLFYIALFSITHTVYSEAKNINMPISSLERWQEINWTFVLWFWTIWTENVYYAYQEISNDRYSLKTLPLTPIQETDEISPSYVKSYKCDYVFWIKGCSVTDNTIYVPKWTIKKEFNL